MEDGTGTMRASGSTSMLSAGDGQTVQQQQQQQQQQAFAQVMPVAQQVQQPAAQAFAQVVPGMQQQQMQLQLRPAQPQALVGQSMPAGQPEGQQSAQQLQPALAYQQSYGMRPQLVAQQQPAAGGQQPPTQPPILKPSPLASAMPTPRSTMRQHSGSQVHPTAQQQQGPGAWQWPRRFHLLPWEHYLLPAAQAALGRVSRTVAGYREVSLHGQGLGRVSLSRPSACWVRHQGVQGKHFARCCGCAALRHLHLLLTASIRPVSLLQTGTSFFGPFQQTASSAAVCLPRNAQPFPRLLPIGAPCRTLRCWSSACRSCSS